MEPSPSIETKIKDRLEKVDRLCSRVTAARVVVEAPHRIRLSIRLPRTLLTVSKGELKNGEHTDLGVVVRDAFDAAERALRE